MNLYSVTCTDAFEYHRGSTELIKPDLQPRVVVVAGVVANVVTSKRCRRSGLKVSANESRQDSMTIMMGRSLRLRLTQTRVLRGPVSRTALRACHARKRLLRCLNSTARSGQNGQAQPSGRQQRQRERSPSSENRRLKASSIAAPAAKLFAVRSSQVVSIVRAATLPAQHLFLYMYQYLR